MRHRLRILWTLYRVWGRWPELRLCQLLLIAVDHCSAPNTMFPSQLFYVTDLTLQSRLEDFGEIRQCDL